MFTTFNRTDISFFKHVNKYGKQIVLIFYIYCIKLEKVRVIIFPFIISHFSFVSNAKNFFIHSLNRFAFNKTAYTFLAFFNKVPYMQTYLSNACKMDGEEKLFDFYNK